MHRFIEWVTDLIDDYGESFIEAPLKTLSKTVSWIFSIVIGVMSVVAYIKFIAGGGYPHAIATIKNSEEGFFAGVGDTFTNGTVHMVANNGVYKALGIIFIVQIVLALIMLFFEGKIWKWILAIIDFILIAVSGIWSLVKYNQYNKLYASLEKLYDNEEIDEVGFSNAIDKWINSIRDNIKIFAIIAAVAVVLFVVVIMISEGRCAIFSFAKSAAMPLAILILENIIGLAIGLVTIIVIGIILLIICSFADGGSDSSVATEAFDRAGNFIGWFHRK